jgi:hypothetical protein
MSTLRPGLRSTVVAALVSALAQTLAAQAISTASPRGLGMGGAYGAVARGVSAGPLNPALLGLPDNPGFTLALPALSLDAGSSPIGWRDVSSYAGKVVPDNVKRDWLARIPAGGTFRLATDVAVQPFGVSFGPVALHVEGIAGGSARLPKDAVSLLLFGNADSADQGGSFSLDRGTAVGFAATSAGLSTGWHLGHVAGGALSVGVTGKLVFGLGFAGLWGSQGSVSATPLGGDLRFPTVTVSNSSSPLDSRGYGLDAGLAWQSRRVTLGVAMSDVVNSFRWRSADARLRDGRVFFNSDSATSSFTDRSLNDPTLDTSVVRSARALLERARFRPALRASGALEAGRGLLLAVEGYHVSGGLTGRELGPWTHGAVGAEWRWLGGVLPIRAGAGLASDGAFDWSAGTGLDFAPFNVNVAYGETRPSGGGTLSRVAVGIGVGRGR